MTRNEEIAEKSKTQSLASIARIYGLSRARVGEIVRRVKRDKARDISWLNGLDADAASVIKNLLRGGAEDDASALDVGVKLGLELHGESLPAEALAFRVRHGLMTAPRAKPTKSTKLTETTEEIDMTAKLRRIAAAAYIRETYGIPCAPSTLAKLAVTGGGPAYYKAGFFPLYDKADLDEWAAKKLGRKLTSSSDQGDV